MNALRRVSDTLHNITSILAATLVSILTVLSIGGVIFRFIFNNPIVWLYEFSLLMFSWIIFLGVAMAFKVQDHMNLTFIVNNLKPKLQYIVKQLIYIVCVIFMVIAIKEGFSIVDGTFDQYYNTLPISKGLFYLSLPLSAIPSIVHIILHMLELKEDPPEQI